MGLSALLVVEYDESISSGNLDVFSHHLDQLGWTPVDEMSNVWWTRFTEEISEASLVGTTRKDVDKAATAAGLVNVNAVLHAGRNRPIRL
jgi:hypothetical protein